MYEYRATVVDWYDADSPKLRVDVGFRAEMEMRFRLRGVNAPEVRGIEADQGRLARDAARALAPLGSMVTIRTHKTGKYGRWLCDVQLADGSDLATRLLDEGLALPYDGKGPMPRFTSPEGGARA